ncbi:MAG TPA: FAD-binding protein [Candidatus Agrococcus pullicola]|uniref:FAD-binding protein n=1 Tax=Candidatus Agrococcus pullicola TaxID=2838429 RepID=A0A9D2C9X2_9MICO|nr:FAD-binding protein [Candidatus Agrococcus pullicola]
MRIGIIGAGIAGLCTAVGFQRAGADVVVMERGETVREGLGCLSSQTGYGRWMRSESARSSVRSPDARKRSGADNGLRRVLGCRPSLTTP